jgi:molybdate transport system substrate-binding protein
MTIEWFRRGGLALGLLGALIAAPVAAKPVPEPITVFAAASLKESLDAAAAAWEKRSGQHVVVSYGASSALARQIEKDAPADVFVSADEDWMDYLAERKRLAAGTRFDLVGNRLVLVAPAASGLAAVDLRNPVDFVHALGEGRVAIADVETVPAGKYGKQALERLNLWPAVSAHLAPAENVRGALAFVARAEAPLGVVYATDARAEPRVRVVATFPADTHVRIVYPVAALARPRATASSKAFLAFLRSPHAQAIFLRAGFTAP